ncbi:MAG: glycosyltransferase [Candidatus Berkelbacteria bacterium]|nr:glycosyltransferase [Candidatus Berkelbacteria bacterium]
MKVSIIIVNFNGEEIIQDCLHSIYKQTFRDFEVIIVDNDSSDDSYDLIKKNFSSVRLFKLKKNLGFAKGNNFGYKKALGEYVFLLNPDAVLESENCLKTIVEGFSDIEIGAQAPKILFEFDKSRLDSAGTDFNNLGFNWGRGFREKDGKKFNKSKEVFGATACAMIFRKKIIKSPLFDPSFFMYYEELELSIRIREQ